MLGLQRVTLLKWLSGALVTVGEDLHAHFVFPSLEAFEGEGPMLNWLISGSCFFSLGNANLSSKMLKKSWKKGR